MMTTAPASGPAAEDQLLNDDVVVEILQRLPTAAVLRSRAVCKAWQRMSSSAEFIAAYYARRHPLELIFQCGGAINGALETIPLGTLAEEERRCLRHLQYPAYTPTGGGRDWSGYLLIDSCDGLLLFQRDSDRKDFAVVNPVTQQWSTVPRVPGAAVYTVPTGFYVHGPSGEHRLLYLAADDQGGSHYVCEPAQAACRRLGQAWPWPNGGNLCADLPVRYVNHGGKLHWSQHPKIRFSTDPWPPGPDRLRLTILAFDTVMETFRRIRHPPWKGHSSFLLEMDGMLAIGDFHILRRFMDIWVLQDYNDDESWTLRVRVQLPEQLRGTCWAMNTGTGRSVILLGNLMGSWVALYDVAEKRVLKQTQLATSDNCIIPLNVFVFKDTTLERRPSIFTNESATPPIFSRKRKLSPYLAD